MLYSKMDRSCKLTNDDYCVTLMYHSNRMNQRHGLWGAIFIEGLDEQGQSFIYRIGYPFNSSSHYEISRITSQKCSVPESITKTYIVDKDKIDTSVLGGALRTQNIPDKDFNEPVDYSYKKSSQLLIQLGIHDSVGDDDLLTYDFDVQPTQWNPFAILMESKKFPTARIVRSSLWTRIKDIFTILNGNLYSENKLGILDYLFPLPRLLTAIMIADVNPLIQVALFIPASTLVAVRTVAALVITAALSPLVVPFHYALEWMTHKSKKEISALKVKPINGEFEDIADFPSTDLQEEQTLSSGSYGIVTDTLRIKPIIENGDHYEEISSHCPLTEGKHVALGLFQSGVPRAVIDISPTNYKGIFSLMERNVGGISTELEETGAMEQVLNTVTM